MTIWYTADTHFGHENVIRFCKRPFKSASQMDGVMLENLWKVVEPEDDLWIIGDFAFGPKSKDSQYVEQIFNQLPGARQHLVIGNLDLSAFSCEHLRYFKQLFSRRPAVIFLPV